MIPHQKFKVIYDTDPGVDDAMALYFALAHPKIELIGVTTCYGNVSVEQATVNALYLLSMTGLSIPVCPGAAKPLLKYQEDRPLHIHGEDGLGNLGDRFKFSNSVDPRSSAQFIVEMARTHPNKIDLVAVGPLTNLSMALALEPMLPTLLKSVVIMGGAITEPGNVSAVSEANIWNDPDAAKHVFHSNFKLTMVGLDVTHRLMLPLSLFKSLSHHHKHSAFNTLYRSVSFYVDFHTRYHPQLAEINGCFGHDILAFIALVSPDFFRTESGFIDVITNGVEKGRTVFSSLKDLNFANFPFKKRISPIKVCLQVDHLQSLALIEATLRQPWLL